MAHPELETLITKMAPFAMQQLGEHDGFYPFAASINQSGEVIFVSTYPEQERPDPKELIADYDNILRREAEAGNIRAAAVVMDAKVSQSGSRPTDAIQANMEHENGESVTMCIPYTKIDGHIEYGEPFSTLKDRVWFAK